MRITGGIHKSRTLVSPKDKNTRPTSDRARLSIFNILRHNQWQGNMIEDATVLDVFAGTGALGLEATAAHRAWQLQEKLLGFRIDERWTQVNALLTKYYSRNARPAQHPLAIHPFQR